MNVASAASAGGEVCCANPTSKQVRFAKSVAMVTDLEFK